MLDVAASGVWGGRLERIFIDVRVFNPFDSSNRATSLAASYRRHEQEKHEERVPEVEHASFVPVVLSASGGYGKHANALFSRIASLLAEKSKEQGAIRAEYLLAALPPWVCPGALWCHVPAWLKEHICSCRARVPCNASSDGGTHPVNLQ